MQNEKKPMNIISTQCTLSNSYIQISKTESIYHSVSTLQHAKRLIHSPRNWVKHIHLPSLPVPSPQVEFVQGETDKRHPVPFRYRTTHNAPFISPVTSGRRCSTRPTLRVVSDRESTKVSCASRRKKMGEKVKVDVVARRTRQRVTGAGDTCQDLRHRRTSIDVDLPKEESRAMIKPAFPFRVLVAYLWISICPLATHPSSSSSSSN